MDVIAELVGRLGYEVDDSGLAKFERGTQQAGKSTSGLEGKVASAAKGIAKFTAAAIAAGAALVANLIKNVAEAGDEIAKTSAQLGVATDDLQRLRFAAERSGASADNLDKAIKKLNVGLVDATLKGTGPAAEGLEVLGLTAAQLEGLSVEEKFGVIAESLTQVEDASLRSALAAKLFGERAGPQILPLLDQGAAGISALGDRAEELGGVLGEKALRDAEAFQDGLLDVKTAAFGAGAQIVQGLVPQVTNAASGIADWVAENDEFIKQDLPAFLELVGTMTGEVISFFVEAATSVDDFIAEIEDLVEEIDQEYGPQIDAAIEAGSTLVDIWGDIAAAIGRGISKLLEFVNVLDDADGTIRRIKVGLGIDDEPTTNVRGGQTFLGGQANENNRANERRREDLRARDRAAQEAREAQARSEEDARKAAKVRTDRERAQQQADFRKRFEKLSKGGGKKGRGRKKVDTSEAEAQFGERLRSLGSFAGASDKAIDQALEAAAQSLEDGASSGVALEAGVGRLESLTGATLGGGESSLEAALLGGGRSRPGGGGATPTSGAKFVRIDASFNAPTTVTIPVSSDGLSAAEVAEEIREVLEDTLTQRNREAFDHYRTAVQE